MGKESASNARDTGRGEFDPQIRKIPRRSVWKPTPVFFPGESHGQRSLVGYSPQGRKESDTTKQPSTQARNQGTKIYNTESTFSLY